MRMGIQLKKPVEAIQCVNNFSLLQRKMYNVLLANAVGNLRPEVTHRISMKELCKLMGYKSNDYKTIKDKFRELRRMDIEWDIINEDGNKVWTNTSPLSLSRVIEGEGICEYEFTVSLLPYLDKPAQYAKFSLLTQSKFKSSYGLALYENCERYKKIGHTRAFDVPVFRKLMGVAENDYLDFFALKRRVIKKAVDEVNAYSGFKIDPEYKKEGRSVKSIRFLISNVSADNDHKKEQINSLPCLDPDQKKALENDLKDYFGISSNSMNKYLKEYGFSILRKQIDNILSSDAFQSGAIRNMAAYLKTALNENYEERVSSKKILLTQLNSRENLKILKLEHDEKLNELKNKYKNYLSSKVPEVLNLVQVEEKDSLMKAFEEYIGATVYSASYFSLGFSDILVRDQFVRFIQVRFPSVLDFFDSFDDFSKKENPNLLEEIKNIENLLKK